jgi:hypothetical protein
MVGQNEMERLSLARKKENARDKRSSLFRSTVSQREKSFMWSSPGTKHCRSLAEDLAKILAKFVKKHFLFIVQNNMF